MSGPPARLESSGPPDRFRTTHWSLILAAREHDSPEARQALEELCECYWYPLYAFIRRSGHNSEEARDLTQEFFARLLEKDYLAAVNRDKGKFRSFLLAACKHFLANERDRALAQKRGGGRTILSFNADAAESTYSSEPQHTLTPERLYERRWVLMLLQSVLNRLRKEQEKAGKGTHFDQLKGFLAGDRAATRYSQVAEALGTSVGALKVAVHRLRGRYRELLREEIARTVNSPDEVEAEIRNLFSALGP
jgi:RNA polymerase sigma-70 factor (ECF subfamily)